MNYILLLISLVFNALANVFIKAGMRCYSGSINFKMLFYILKNPFVILGLLFFGGAFIGYSFLLSRMQLSIAYPIMTGAGFAIVCILSSFWFNESFNLLKIFGILLIFIGIVFLSRG